MMENIRNVAFNKSIVRFQQQLTISEKNISILEHFLIFLENHDINDKNPVPYGLLVHASEKNFRNKHLKQSPNHIFVLSGLTFDSDTEHIYQEFKMTPEIIKIVIVYDSLTDQKLKENSDLYYRVPAPSAFTELSVLDTIKLPQIPDLNGVNMDKLKIYIKMLMYIFNTKPELKNQADWKYIRELLESTLGSDAIPTKQELVAPGINLSPLKCLVMTRLFQQTANLQNSGNPFVNIK